MIKYWKKIKVLNINVNNYIGNIENILNNVKKVAIPFGDKGWLFCGFFLLQIGRVSSKEHLKQNWN